MRASDEAGRSLATAKCDACNNLIPVGAARTDNDGFTGCLPCFPVSNRPGDADRFMRGPCYRKDQPA